MRALHLDKLNVDQLRGLDDLHRMTRDVRVRTRAQMILLLAEQGLTVSEVAAIVRESGETVRRWIHRYEAESIDDLSDAPRSGEPAKTGAASRERLAELVRQRPRALDLPFSMWTSTPWLKPPRLSSTVTTASQAVSAPSSEHIPHDFRRCT